MELDNPSRISVHAYSGKSIFITGTTGFVGKVILEKYLRCLPFVKHIYLLIRGNKNFPDARERFMNEVLTSSIFDSLKEVDQQAFYDLCNKKLRFVSGELTAHNFGLNDSEFSALGDKVDIIINSAASVNFHEPLDQALQTNTLSLYTIINLARIRSIPVVHVSTCYVNGFNNGVIQETVGGPSKKHIPKASSGYLSPYQVEDLISELKNLSSQVAARHSDEKERSSALVELGMKQASHYGWNDTYTFTKWLGEQILLQHLRQQSLTILRPSIVESTLQEPSPGWIEGVKVADAIILAYAREKVSFFPGNPDAVIDIIPADLVANSIIVAGAESLSLLPQHRIYQCSSSHCNPVTIRNVIDYVVQEAQENHHLHKNLFLRRPKRSFMMVPGWAFQAGINLAYGILKLQQGLQQRLGFNTSTRSVSKLDTAKKLARVFSFYTRPRYQFCNAQLRYLYARLDPNDQPIFNMDVRKISWNDYIRNVHVPGLNRFALRPNPKTEQRVKAKAQPVTV